MPSKNNMEKKAGSVSTKKGAKQVSIGKPEKIAFSFSANANLCDGGVSIGNSHCVWISKLSMIKCGLSYGDVVIVQTMKDTTRIFSSKSFMWILI